MSLFERKIIIKQMKYLNAVHYGQTLKLPPHRRTLRQTGREADSIGRRGHKK